MRSLRSGRTKDLTVNKINKKSENTNPKMCNKRSKPSKTETRRERPVLADKTNSDLDTNSSSNVSTTTRRPKRTQNLPAKFQDHELSPIKNYRPEYSSTPIAVKKHTTPKTQKSSIKVKTRSRNAKENEGSTQVNSEAPIPLVTVSKNTPMLNLEKNVTDKSTPIYKRGVKQTKNDNYSKIVPSGNATPLHKKSVILLEKPKIQTPDRMALYDFDFDPSEEPTLVKKKKVRKNNPPKKKTRKVDPAKDDAALQDLIEKLKSIQERQKCKKLMEKKKLHLSNKVTSGEIPKVVQNVNVSNTHSEIPAVSNENNFSKSLSPIPRQTLSPMHVPEIVNENNFSNIHGNDPPSSSMCASPIASSSMLSKSLRKSMASPWRVNIEADNRKWPLNFHVKPSMTPAYDRDTVHVIGLSKDVPTTSEKSKHIYTNISINSSHNEDEQAEKKLANWKQTSILSFYEESLRKSAKKRSHSPKKHVDSYNFDYLVPETNELCDSMNDSQTTTTKPNEKATVDNCFGFDDSADLDQENLSPAKIPKIQNINTVRGTFKKTRRVGILKELNNDNLPMRVLPKDVLNIIEKQKFMEDIEEPQVEEPIDKFPELVQDSDDNVSSDDDSIHHYEHAPQLNEIELFAEPIEPDLVHFSKPSRRSYETRKKGQLTFLLPTTVRDKSFNSDTDSDHSSANVTKSKKVVKKKKKQGTKTKKEEKQIDDWAAGFNSMLEEVEEFPLTVE